MTHKHQATNRPRNIKQTIYFRRSFFWSLLLVAIWVIWSRSATASSLNEVVRAREITECRANEIMTWNDGKDRPAVASKLIFSYTHQSSPTWFSEPEVSQMLAKSVAAWSQCGIEAQLLPWKQRSLSSNNQIVVLWSEKESRGNFALANLPQQILAMSPKAFALLRERNPSHDARQTLQMVLSHEMGHFFGLMAHSRRCVDVMSYYNNPAGEKCVTRNPSIQIKGIAEYRHLLPTACDIERCRRINGKPPLSSGMQN